MGTGRGGGGRNQGRNGRGAADRARGVGGAANTVVAEREAQRAAATMDREEEEFDNAITQSFAALTQAARDSGRPRVSAVPGNDVTTALSNTLRQGMSVRLRNMGEGRFRVENPESGTPHGYLNTRTNTVLARQRIREWAQQNQITLVGTAWLQDR